MHETFPLLDPATASTWSSRRGFAAWLLPDPAAAAPRRYVHATPDELVLYDGSVVDPSGRCAAHDAAELASYWPDLPGRLEGRFVVVRLDARSETLELVNDPFGLHQTFVHQRGSTWWVSNSARLLAKVTGSTSIDLDGMAQCIGMFFPGGDRTLVEGISVVPAGQHWLWDGEGAPRRSTYADPADLARLPKRSFGAREAEALAGEMRAVLRPLSEAFGTLQCPITAGRDSRMLTGLVMTAGFPATYFTSGDPESEDVKIGKAVAERFGLPHTNSGAKERALAEAWEAVSRRVVQMHDGTVTLMHARNGLKRPARLERIVVQLYGAGGELGRGVRLDEGYLLTPPSLARAEARAQSIFVRSKGLLRPEADEVLRAHVARTCRSLLERGFAPIELVEAFDLTEYGRRWAGAQARQVVDHKDVILPFFTQAYLRAGFATPAHERLMERVPFELLRHLSPELHALPFQKPWPRQRFAELLLARVLAEPGRQVQRVVRRLSKPHPIAAGRKRDRLYVLEAHLPRWRERILDRADSCLWSIVDRERFERLTAEDAAPKREGRFPILYQALTAFMFEEDLQQWAGGEMAALAR
jgi:asparagine synthase (glutamine-hydrolysing)